MFVAPIRAPLQSNETDQLWREKAGGRGCLYITETEEVTFNNAELWLRRSTSFCIRPTLSAMMKLNLPTTLLTQTTTLLSCSRLLSFKGEIIDFPLRTDWDDSRQSKQRHCHAGKYGSSRTKKKSRCEAEFTAVYLEYVWLFFLVGYGGEMFGWSEIWGHILSNLRCFAASAKGARPGNMLYSSEKRLPLTHRFYLYICAEEIQCISTHPQVTTFGPTVMYFTSHRVSVLFLLQNVSLIKPWSTWHTHTKSWNYIFPIKFFFNPYTLLIPPQFDPGQS